MVLLVSLFLLAIPWEMFEHLLLHSSPILDCYLYLTPSVDEMSSLHPKSTGESGAGWLRRISSSEERLCSSEAPVCSREAPGASASTAWRQGGKWLLRLQHLPLSTNTGTWPFRAQESASTQKHKAPAQLCMWMPSKGNLNDWVVIRIHLHINVYK